MATGMKQHCEIEGCDNEASVHEVVIRNGQKVERHLCKDHAHQEGLVSVGHAPINELLSKFVISQSAGQSSSQQREKEEDDACDQCGMTYAEFRKRGLMGCPGCYSAFEEQLGPLLERAHEGATHHVGKVPRRAGRSVDRQQRVAHLRRLLQQAIDAEEYEKAASIRDDLLEFERIDEESVESGEERGESEGGSA